MKSETLYQDLTETLKPTSKESQSFQARQDRACHIMNTVVNKNVSVDKVSKTVDLGSPDWILEGDPMPDYFRHLLASYQRMRGQKVRYELELMRDDYVINPDSPLISIFVKGEKNGDLSQYAVRNQNHRLHIETGHNTDIRLPSVVRSHISQLSKILESGDDYQRSRNHFDLGTRMIQFAIRKS